MKNLALLLVLILAVTKAQENQNVTIGLYLEPSEYSEYPTSKYSYLAASYVKYIEMAGAQVVPIYYDADQNYYDSILTKINGILFPGGGVEFGNNPFTNNARYIYNKAIQMNQAGIHFPVWGTCLGFELLMTLQANASVLTNIKNESGVSHPLQIIKNGILFNGMPDYLYQVSQDEPLYYFNHQWCVTPQTFNSHDSLKNFFNILSNSYNVNKEVFISSVEAKDYPIWGSQFHPEKNPFEWRVPANHGLNAIMGSQYFADFFVNQARRNFNKFSSQNELNQNLIYNWNAVVLPPSESSFTQVYFIPNFSSSQYETQTNIKIIEQ